MDFLTKLFTTKRPDVIWPDFHYKGSQQWGSDGYMYYVQMETYIRIKHDGKWWLTKIFRDGQIKPNDEHSGLHAMYASFIHEVQMKIVLGIPDASITDTYGKPVFWLDPIQEEEKERMSKLFYEFYKDKNRDGDTNDTIDLLPGH